MLESLGPHGLKADLGTGLERGGWIAVARVGRQQIVLQGTAPRSGIAFLDPEKWASEPRWVVEPINV